MDIIPDVITWWRHQMETFSALLGIYAGNSPVLAEFPTQRPVTRNFDVFFDLRLNKWLSKQSWGWWFETLPRPLWCHSNDKCLVKISSGYGLMLLGNIDELVQERCNSIANTLELRLSCTNPLIRNDLNHCWQDIWSHMVSLYHSEPKWLVFLWSV